MKTEKPRTIMTQFRLSEDDRTRLARLAERYQISMRTVVSAALEHFEGSSKSFVLLKKKRSD